MPQVSVCPSQLGAPHCSIHLQQLAAACPNPQPPAPCSQQRARPRAIIPAGVGLYEMVVAAATAALRRCCSRCLRISW